MREYNLEKVLNGEPAFTSSGLPVTNLQLVIGKGIVVGLCQGKKNFTIANTGMPMDEDSYHIYTDKPPVIEEQFTSIYLNKNKRKLVLGATHFSEAAAIKHCEDYLAKNPHIELVNTIGY